MSEVDVLVLGLCRTGTMSMKFALEELGYNKVYHFFEVSENSSHANSWIEVLKTKYEPDEAGQKKWTSADWHGLFRGYNAITDIPAAYFAPELINAYPDAKIILTTRSPESWQRSMLRTIHALNSSYFTRVTLLFSNQDGRLLFKLLDLVIKYYFQGDIVGHGVEIFAKHNNFVRELALSGNKNFLEFHLGDDWGPLCQFLGKPLPEIDFPHVNDSDSFRKSFQLGCNFPPMMVGVGSAILIILIGILYTSHA